MSFKNRECLKQHISSSRHPDFVFTETRVSEFLRLYGTGKLQNLPEDNRPEIIDNRSEDEMLSDSFCPSMATEEVEVLAMLQEQANNFEQAMQDAILTHKDSERAKVLLDVLRNSDSLDEKQAAFQEMQEIKDRARARKSK